MTSTNAIHVLDDFIDSLEGYPLEISNQLKLLEEKDVEFEEIRRSLFKKRNLLLKAQEKDVDTNMQAILRRKADKDSQRALQLINEKLEIEGRLQTLIDGHLKRLETDANLKLNNLHFSQNHIDMFSDIPDPPLTESESQRSLAASLPKPGPRVSPKKRSALNDEPIDPNEPVYCTCQQVSYGDMIACDNVACAREWFHLSCVGLQSPPKGKWYCSDCSSKYSSLYL